MATEALFISQKQLEGWIENGEVSFTNDILCVLATQTTYELKAAVKVLSLIDGSDEMGLLGGIFSIEKLAELGIEHYPSSLIRGETGYECEEGFLACEPVAETPGDASSTDQAELSDTDLLTDFLLKHL